MTQTTTVINEILTSNSDTYIDTIIECDYWNSPEAQLLFSNKHESAHKLLIRRDITSKASVKNDNPASLLADVDKLKDISST